MRVVQQRKDTSVARQRLEQAAIIAAGGFLNTQNRGALQRTLRRIEAIRDRENALARKVVSRGEIVGHRVGNRDERGRATNDSAFQARVKPAVQWSRRRISARADPEIAEIKDKWNL